MQIKTKFSDKGTFHKELLNLINSLLDTYNSIDTVLTEKLYPVKNDQYHFIVRLLKTDERNRTAFAFLSLLFKDIYKTEVLSAKSGQVTFLFALNFVKNVLRSNLALDNERKLFTDWENAIVKLKTKLESISSSATEEQIKNIVFEVCDNDVLSNVCWEALKLSGLEGKIFIENTKNEKYVIETKNGYSFNLKPYSFFLENNLWQHNDVKVLVVDGFVENISEIDQIINAAFETKNPVVIVSQGFSEEVVSTLYVNFQRKTLNVIPVRVMPDLNSINLIGDVSIVCGADPISSLKGQMLTFVKWDDLPTVEKISITSAKTTIEHSKTRAAVSNQIRMLMQKRDDKHVIEDIQDLLDERIKNLTSNSVIINLPNSSTVETDTTRVKLDNALRQVKTVLNYGCVDMSKLDGVLAESENLLEKILFATIKETLEKKNYPLLSAYLPAFITGKTMLMMLSAAGRVELDFID